MSEPTAAPKDHRREDILLYQQNYLDAAERAELEAHMRDCAACQATMEKVARFLPALQQALTPKLRSSAELLAAAKAQLAADERKPARLPLWQPVVAWLGLTAASAVIFLVLKPGPGPGPGPDIAHSGQVDAGQAGGMVAAPHRPEFEDHDAGMDGGMP